MTFPSIIAIDGPAASGKSTLGYKLAQELGYLYFDTGVMYRAVTWLAQYHGLDIHDEAAVSRLAEEARIDVLPPSQRDGRTADVTVDGQDVTWEIRRPEVERKVSVVAAYPGVRAALTLQQRRIGLRGQVVMVGRDIGTVVLPEAEVKIYLDASVEERARRRYAELQERGVSASLEEITRSMRRRDELDSTRAVAPLRAAEDAIIINSDHMDVDDVLAKVKALCTR
ncbi:MAG: (d)CMP kinase [Anaerolineales bacterium]